MPDAFTLENDSNGLEVSLRNLVGVDCDCWIEQINAKPVSWS